MALFFGYGANRNKQKLAQVLCHDLGEELGAIVEGFQLAYQNLEQLPDFVAGLIREVYGNEYKTYTLVRGDGIVSGGLFELSEGDLEVIKEWEFIGVWRELVEVEVRLSNGHTLKALTEKAFDDCEIEEVVDGLLYDEFVQPEKEKFDRKAMTFYTEQQINQIKDWLKKQHHD